MQLRRVSGGDARAYWGTGEAEKREMLGWLGCPERVTHGAMTETEPGTLVFDIAGLVISAAHLFAGAADAEDDSGEHAADLPVAYSGRLTIDEGSGLASITLFGSFTGSTESRTFGIELTDLIAGVSVTQDEVTIADVFDDVSFSLSLDRQSGTGRLSYQERVMPGGEPVTRLAECTIGFAEERVELDASAGVLIAGLFAQRRRR